MLSRAEFRCISKLVEALARYDCLCRSRHGVTKPPPSHPRARRHRLLINGQRLAELMIEYSVGVSTVRTIALKRVDSDYFEEA